MEFKNILAWLGVVVLSLHRSESCHVEQRAAAQCSAMLDAATIL